MSQWKVMNRVFFLFWSSEILRIHCRGQHLLRQCHRQQVKVRDGVYLDSKVPHTSMDTRQLRCRCGRDGISWRTVIHSSLAYQTVADTAV